MRTLRVIREQECYLPDRNTKAWAQLEQIINDQFEPIDAGYILSDDEHVAMWLAREGDVGNYEVQQTDTPTVMGSADIGEAAFDPKIFRSTLTEVIPGDGRVAG